MQFEQFCRTVDFSLENGCYIYNGAEAGVMESAFLSYYLIREGSAHKAIPFINKISKKITDRCVQYIDEVLWLWVLGEYINNSKAVEWLDKLAVTIDVVLDDISRQWQVPRTNWICPSEEGLYLSNIAMAYGAVQSINNSLRSGKAQQLLIAIRDFTFKKFLKGGKIVSRLGNEEIFGDISIVAVPFALLDAGNQILVESIKTLEEQLVSKGVRFSNGDTYYGGCTRNDLTCLLSWYYSERGDIARSKWLLDQVATVWDRDGKLYEVDIESRKEELYYHYWLEKKNGVVEESFLSYILYFIAKQNISDKEKAGVESKGELSIIHNPTGTGNPYLFENFERYPRNPEESENVQLKMITDPFNTNQKAYVEYMVNGTIKEKLEMRVNTSKEGDKFWQTGIGSFNFGDRIEYYFEVHDNSVVTRSARYEFKVRKWHRLDKIIHASNDKGVISIFFEPLPGSSKVPRITIGRYGENTVKWSFSMDDISDVPKGNAGAGGYDTVSIKLDDYNLEFSIKDMLLKILSPDRGSVAETYGSHDESFVELLTDCSGCIYKIRYKFRMKPDERIFGMGERFSDIEFRGLDVDNYVYNQYRDQGLRTYIPVPFAISSGGYGIYLDTAYYSVFRFGTRLSDMFELEADLDRKEQSACMYVFAGTPKEIIQQFAKITGRPVLPPKWAFGPWMSSNNWDSQAETLKQVELTKKYKIPATVLVLEQWSDEATFYIFNDAQYKVKDGNEYLKYEDFTFPEWGRWPDPKKMVEKLHDEGLKVLLWQAPVQKFMDGIAHAQRDEDEKAMLEKGYHVKYRDGGEYRIPAFEWFKRSLVPDFTNPEAREWWFNKRLYLVKDIGIDGFKTDGGECVYGDDVLLYDGTAGNAARNRYPNIYIGSYHEFINRHTGGKGITFSRAGYTGAQAIPLHWAGDERSTFDAFRSSVRAGLSCGMSGIPFWGWDLAGFNGPIPTAELYVRAAQMAAFCPVMQYHAETKGEFNQDRTPWNIAERTGEAYVIDIYKRYADLRMNLLPYIYQEALSSCQTGIPMMRAMFMEYPEDMSCRELTGQYFFGESLLVAPVMEEGGSTKNIYFPQGKWMDFFTGEEITGSRFATVKAGIDKIPVYIKENSIIPLNLSESCELCSHVGNRVDGYENLCFLIYVNDILSYRFADDLGNEVDIISKKNNNKLHINVSFTSVSEKSIVLMVRNLKGKVGVSCSNTGFCRVNDVKSLEDGTYQINGDCLLVRLSCLHEDYEVVIEEI